MRSISSSVTVSAVRSYSFVVLGDAWPAICWACSSVPPFDRYAVIGLFAGGGEILRLARPASRSSGFRMQGPSGPAPAAGPDHRLLGDGGVVPPAGRVPRQGDVWLARPRRYGDMRKALLSAPAVADADRSPPAPASPHDWLAERRFAEGPAPAGPPRRGPVRSLAEASKTACSASRGRKPPCRTGPLTWSPTLYRRMPAARPGELLAPSPYGHRETLSVGSRPLPQTTRRS